MAERGDESLRVDSSETNTVLVLPFSCPLPTAPTDLLSVRSAAPADCDMLFAAPTKFAVPAGGIARRNRRAIKILGTGVLCRSPHSANEEDNDRYDCCGYYCEQHIGQYPALAALSLGLRIGAAGYHCGGAGGRRGIDPVQRTQLSIQGVKQRLCTNAVFACGKARLEDAVEHRSQRRDGQSALKSAPFCQPIVAIFYRHKQQDTVVLIFIAYFAVEKIALCVSVDGFAV